MTTGQPRVEQEEWRREEEQETLQGCSGRGAQFQRCKGKRGTGSQGARWVGASPVFCNYRVATDFCPELPPLLLAACPWAVHPVRKFPLLKVTPDATYGRIW